MSVCFSSIVNGPSETSRYTRYTRYAATDSSSFLAEVLFSQPVTGNRRIRKKSRNVAACSGIESLDGFSTTYGTAESQ
jgi:hypothetical protein